MRQQTFSRAQSERGVALLILLLILSITTFSTLLVRLNSATQATLRDQITIDALTQAKEALIGYATSVTLMNPARPGDLPCPDNHPPGDPFEGQPSTPCNGNALGRLPWKKLGLPDLRDSSGERLWYAVSSNFKDFPRTVCYLPGQLGCLNSNTLGSITIRDPTGVIFNNGTDVTGAIAIIIAPGRVLTRQDGVSQVRDPGNTTNPINYLDIGNGEDNASFANNNIDGFINGIVRDANNNIIVNDHVLAITADNLMPILEQRVAGEAMACLTEYAAKPQNQGHYPWAVALSPGAPPDYTTDTSGNRFGRMADTFSATKADSGNAMDDSWTGNCNINPTSDWWTNWKEHVFYSIADAYKPALTLPNCGGTGTCLVVNPPSTAANKRVAVLVAGRRLTGVAAGQPRMSNSDKGTITNYLEGENAAPMDDVYSKTTLSAAFNDHVLFQ